MTPAIEPKVYTIKEVQQILGVSQSAIYRLITKSPPFRVLKIGSTYRIPKEGFDAWMQNAHDCHDCE